MPQASTNLQPIRTTSYEDSHAPDIEFQIPHEHNHPQADQITYVRMHDAKKAEKGKPLVSAGFGSCVGLLIKDPTSKTIGLLHIGNPNLTAPQKALLQEFVHSDQPPIGLFIKSPNADCSERSAAITKAVCAIVPKLQIETLSIADEIQQTYWDMAYRHEKDELLIEVGDKKEVRVFNPFTEIEKHRPATWQDRTAGRQDFGVP